MPENCAAIIDTLIKQRKEKGLTQKQLAKEAELTQSVIARMESKRLYLNLIHCKKLLELLDVI